MKTLRPPQAAHLERLLTVLEKHNSALDGSHTGLGKMVVGAEVLRQLKRPALIVAPLSTLPEWRKELNERGVANAQVTNYEKLRSKKSPFVQKARNGIWQWTLPPDTVIVGDEIQRTKSPTSITDKIFCSARNYTNLMLSASVAENPLHLRAVGYLLGLHSLRDFWSWSKRHGCKPAIFGGLEFTGGIDDLHKLHREIFPEHGSRMDIKEMAEFMPENNILFEELDFGDHGKIASIYEELEEDLLALAEAADNDSKGAEILTAQLRARQEAELLKVPVLAERAADIATEGVKVVVFLNFTASLNALSERLHGIPIISGQHGDRQQVIEAFQRDETPILGVNVAAGGVGISLHGKAPRQTILSPSFNPIDILQALGRAPRFGGGATTQHVLAAVGTIEIKVLESLRQKLANIETINSGDSQKNWLREKMKEIAENTRRSEANKVT